MCVPGTCPSGRRLTRSLPYATPGTFWLLLRWPRDVAVSLQTSSGLMEGGSVPQRSLRRAPGGRGLHPGPFWGRARLRALAPASESLISVRPAVQMAGNFQNHKPQSLLLESFLGASFSPCIYHKPQRGSRPRRGHFAWKCLLLTRRFAPSARHPLPATRQAPPGLPWLPRALRDAPSTGSAASDFSRACVSAHVRSLHPGFPMRPRHPSSPPTVLPQIHLRILLQPHPTIRQRSRVPQAVCVYRVNAYVDHTHGSTSYIF